MGRKHFGNNLRMRVQDGQRKTFHNNDHDDRFDGAGGSNNSGGRDRVWRKGQNNPQQQPDYQGHNNNKKVSFKDRGGMASSGGIKKRLGGSGSGQFNRNIILGDDDANMGGQGGSNNRGYQAGRARGPGIRRGRGRGRGGYHPNRVDPSMVIKRMGGTAPGTRSWHKATIANGARYPKEELLTAIIQACTVPIAPICYTKMAGNTVFYVETYEMANALKVLNQNLTLNDGFKLIISVTNSPPPTFNLTDDVIQKVKMVMGSPERYKVENNALDLSKFHSDKAFLGEPIYATLARSQMIKEITKIIGENIPQIQALEMSGNRINTLDGFQELVERAPNVKILYFANNNIRDTRELEKCKGWKLEQLKLTGNPICTKYGDVVSYQTAVRKVFPSLKILDDAELPKLITFEVEDEGTSSLPPIFPKMSVATPDKEAIVNEFMMQFYKLYDSDSRQQLLEAYHEQATMSMAVAYPPNVPGKGLNTYFSESRNLIRVGGEGDTRRKKCLKRGKLSIVTLLDSLPKTEHDLGSFTLDVTIATETTIVLAVTGVFREREDPARMKPLRHFSRLFVIMNVGAGWNIVNETFFITNPTPLQVKTAFESAPTPSTSQQPTAQPQLPDPAMMQAMVLELAKRTNMNEKFTRICLGESGWNLEVAFAQFQNAQRENKIPIEAFEKF